MDFDFYQQYKDYSNIDLLKIVRQPANYQEAAVAAAESILAGRQVSAEEISFADQYLLDIENSEKDKKEKITALKNKVTELLEPVTNPNEKVEPHKWVNILLLFISIQYIWTLYKAAIVLIRFLQCNYCSFDINIILVVLTLIYVPVIFFLLFKRKRWGWILLFADNLFILISGIYQSYFFFKYQNIHQGNITTFLLPMVIRAAFVAFLWRDSIANHFRITPNTKKDTALITTGGTLLIILTLFFSLDN